MKELQQKKLFDLIQSYQNIVWDWNGTLIDDAWVAAQANAILLKEAGLPEINLEKYRRDFCYPIQDYYKTLGFDLQKTDFHSIGDRFIELYTQLVAQAELFSGTTEILQKIQDAGLGQCILSAAKEVDILALLGRFGIRDHFGDVFGLDNHYDINKLKRGERMMQETGWTPQETVLIGDTDHDKEVADHLGIDLVLVADGHQDYDRLSTIHDQVLETRFL